MKLNRMIPGLCAAAIAFSPAVHAAPLNFGFHAGPVAKMSCTGSSQTTKFDLSFFSLASSNANETVTGTGSSAGRPDALLPLTIHTGFANVTVLGETYGNGGSFSSCTLTFVDGSGGNISVTLDNVMVQTLKAVGKQAMDTQPADTYLEVVFTYKSASVTINGTTVGGSGAVTTSWK
jgi:hypothetical protein